MRRTFRALSIAALASLVACTGPSGTDAGADAGRPDAPRAPRDAGPPPPPPPSEPGRHDVTVTETRRIVPSTGLPAETVPDHSNNNLDAVVFEGRVYLAWRTAPNHFANPDAAIHVVSSTDETTWRFEASFRAGTDLREPRFLVHDGGLFLYVSRLGTSAIDFEPMGVFVSARTAGGTWPELTPVLGLPEGFLAWRTRTVGGVPYMIGYLGGEMIYDVLDEPRIEVQVLTTDDGLTWRLADDAHPNVYVGGGSETDFELAADGSLYAIIRNEAGDTNGFGSMVCHAPSTDILDWTCVNDPRKYDSPLVFAHDGEIYLVGRRNVSETGAFDVATTEPDHSNRYVLNQLDYWDRPKRCSLWRFVPGEDRIAFVLDLPSRGDTCFAAAIPTGSPDELALYNYSSDVEGPDIGWQDGQAGNTYVYRHVLRFTPRP